MAANSVLVKLNHATGQWSYFIPEDDQPYPARGDWVVVGWNAQYQDPMFGVVEAIEIPANPRATKAYLQIISADVLRAKSILMNGD